MDGPYAHPDAASTCARELLRPVLQRPLFMNVAFAGNALFFGSVNLAVAAASRVGRYSVDDFCADAFDLGDEVRSRRFTLNSR